MKYDVFLRTDCEREFRVQFQASDKENAVERIKSIKNGKLSKYHIVDVKIFICDDSFFLLQESRRKGYNVATDRLNDVVYIFKSGDWDNREVKFLTDNAEENFCYAEEMMTDEMFKWLLFYHNEII